MEVNNAFAFSLASLLLYCIVRIFYIHWYRPKKLERHFNQQGIRGTSYKPFNGDMPEITRSDREARSRPHSLDHDIVPRVRPFFQQMVQKYGKVCLSWMDHKSPRLIIADPDMIKLILADKRGHIVKPPANHFPLRAVFKLGVSSLEGAKWANRRRLINPSFHYEKLKGLVPIFSTSCCDMINRWKKLTTQLDGSREVDVALELQSLTVDVIARTIFGSNYREGKKIFELQKELIELVLEAYHSIYLPGFSFLPSKKNKRRNNLDKEIKSILSGVIDRRQKAILDGEPASYDLLGLLLQCVGDDMSIEDVIGECKVFFFAGQETTTNWLTWAMIVLSMHPDWQEKAREEVLRICGQKMPQFDDLSRLKIVTMVLHEVMRLYPTATAVSRHTIRNTVVGGISIPAGVALFLGTMLLHHDPEYWGEDVAMFRPERFAEGVSNAANNQSAFIPFSSGPRICIGMNFATIEAKIALAMILQNFRFELSPAYVHAPRIVVALQPQYGAPLILHPIRN